jgi:hypothetical protein
MGGPSQRGRYQRTGKNSSRPVWEDTKGQGCTRQYHDNSIRSHSQFRLRHSDGGGGLRNELRRQEAAGFSGHLDATQNENGG